MNNTLRDNDAEQANRLIAVEIINERLVAEPTEHNIAFLAQCFTALENPTVNADTIEAALC